MGNFDHGTTYTHTSSRVDKGFRGGLVFKAQRLVYHSTLGSKVIKKKKKHLNFLDASAGVLGRPQNVRHAGNLPPREFIGQLAPDERLRWPSVLI